MGEQELKDILEQHKEWIEEFCKEHLIIFPRYKIVSSDEFAI
jgi:phosphoribosylamine-glycine ligase